MPHGENWLSLLFERFIHLEGLIGHETWLGHAPVRYVHVLTFALVLLLLLGLGIATKARVGEPQKVIVPGTEFDAATFAELFTGNVLGTMTGIMGRDAAKFFLPLIGTCAFVIFTSNVIGLVPGMTPPTDNLNTTFAMGSVIFLSTHVYGIKEHGIGYLKHFFGPVLFLAPLMFVIEIISHISRPLTLGIRLMANMMADHMVLSIFLGFGWFSWLAWPTVFYVLGCLVVVVQTLVFCLLSTIYISMAIAHDGH